MEERFETFTVFITKLHRCIYKIKMEEMAEFSLKSSHVSCIYYLYKEKKLTAAKLCELCGEDKANVSRAVKYLEEKGLLTCEDSAPKRYQSALSLTPKGRKVAKRLAEKVDSILNVASAELSEEDRLVMYRSLSLIHNNLSKICAEY